MKNSAERSRTKELSAIETLIVTVRDEIYKSFESILREQEGTIVFSEPIKINSPYDFGETFEITEIYGLCEFKSDHNKPIILEEIDTDTLVMILKKITKQYYQSESISSD